MNPHSTAVALAAFVTVVWSSSWVIIRAGLDGPLVTTTVSMTPGALPLLALGLAVSAR